MDKWLTTPDSHIEAESPVKEGRRGCSIAVHKTKIVVLI